MEQRRLENMKTEDLLKFEIRCKCGEIAKVLNTDGEKVCLKCNRKKRIIQLL